MTTFNIEKFVDGDVIFKIGDPADYLYILSEGLVDLLDDKGFVFDQIQKGVTAGVPEKESWRASFGLMVTVVWLYLEVLRLISILRGDR